MQKLIEVIKLATDYAWFETHSSLFVWDSQIVWMDIFIKFVYLSFCICVDSLHGKNYFADRSKILDTGLKISLLEP